MKSGAELSDEGEGRCWRRGVITAGLKTMSKREGVCMDQGNEI